MFNINFPTAQADYKACWKFLGDMRPTLSLVCGLVVTVDNIVL